MTLDVRKNEAASRYELIKDGQRIGLIDYHIGDGVITMPHTEVDKDQEGHGYGSILVAGALEDVRRIGGLRVNPVCPFIASYLTRHPEFSDLV